MLEKEKKRIERKVLFLFFLLKKINFNWGEAGPTGQVDRFSIKWTGFVQPRYSGSYTFYVEYVSFYYY